MSGRRVKAKPRSSRERAESAAQALAEIAREIAGPLDLPAVAERIVTVVLRVLRAHRVTLFELAAGSNDLACVATVGAIAHAEWAGRLMGRGVGVVGRALVEGRPIW